jgi:hypothetical protein
MIVLPAGVGHRRLGGDGLKVIGVKREGKPFRSSTSGHGPFFGAEGRLVKAWRTESKDRPGSPSTLINTRIDHDLGG